MNFKESLEILKGMRPKEPGIIQEALDNAILLINNQIYKEEIDKKIPQELMECQMLAGSAAIFNADFIAIYNEDDGTYKVLKSLELESGKIISYDEYNELLLKTKKPIIVSKYYLDKMKSEIRSKYFKY